MLDMQFQIVHASGVLNLPASPSLMEVLGYTHAGATVRWKTKIYLSSVPLLRPMAVVSSTKGLQGRHQGQHPGGNKQ